MAELPRLPERPAHAHKGSFGTVVVVGGCATMIGAPALCASAALRGGAGLVKAAVPTGVLPFVLTIEPGATGIALGEDAGAAERLLDEADPEGRAILAVGPGLGRSEAAGELVGRLLAGRRAMVLDADGLNLLASTGRARPTPGPNLILTPHPGEFARLAAPLGIRFSPTDPASRPQAATALAAAHRAVVVLKGQGTVIADARRQRVNVTGNAALATAGSGDVLTGLIAALWAQGLSALDAAILGAHLHGLAADLWARDHGPRGLTAGDLAALLPRAMAAYEREHG